MPVSIETAARTFSTKRRIKSNLRATMTWMRLNSLGVLSIIKESTYELLSRPNPVIDEFASHKGRLLQFVMKQFALRVSPNAEEESTHSEEGFLEEGRKNPNPKPTSQEIADAWMKEVQECDPAKCKEMDIKKRPSVLAKGRERFMRFDLYASEEKMVTYKVLKSTNKRYREFLALESLEVKPLITLHDVICHNKDL
ncbi:hypothetical protein J6590_000104 [Homalodisca vitripennis]|nr:hypothetical protein J6590_000104 [Homalodisca vitripennis]